MSDASSPRDDPSADHHRIVTDAVAARLGFDPAAMAAIRATGHPLLVLCDPVRLTQPSRGVWQIVPAGIQLTTSTPGATMVALQGTLPPRYQAFVVELDGDQSVAVLRTKDRWKPISMFLTLGLMEPRKGPHPVVTWLKQWNRRCRWRLLMVGSDDLWVQIPEDAPARDPLVLEEVLAAAAPICEVLHDDPAEWAAFLDIARSRHTLAFRWDPFLMVARALARFRPGR